MMTLLTRDRRLVLALALACCVGMVGCKSKNKKPDDGGGEQPAEQGDERAKKADDEKKAQESYDAALKAEAAGDYVKARDLYVTANTCVKGYKDVEARLQGLSEVIQAKTDLDQASMAENPKKAELQVKYAEALRKRDDLDAAAASLQKAIELNPELALAHTQLASVYFESGDLLGCLDRAQKASEADKTSAEAYYHMAFFNRCAQVEGKAQPDKALDYAKKAVELSGGNDYKMRELLATLLRDAGQLDDAVKELKEAIRVSSSLPRLQKKLDDWAPQPKDAPPDKPAEMPPEKPKEMPPETPPEKPAEPREGGM
ncbi:tetratricopeptide repeat protein [bacterium]|nr:tetratricopeptide repeat protein [bacterium]